MSTITSLVAPTVSLSRDGYTFTLSIGGIDTNASKIHVIRRVFEVGDKKSSGAWDSSQADVGTDTLAATATSWTYTLPKSDYYPYYTGGISALEGTAAYESDLSKRIPRVSFGVYVSTTVKVTTKVNGKKTTKKKTIKSDKTWCIYKFKAAVKPDVSIAYDENGTSFTYGIDLNDDYSIDSDEKAICTRAYGWLTRKEKGGSTVRVSGHNGKWYNSDATKNIRSQITSEIGSVTPIKYVIHAYGAGPGGKSDTVTASHIMARPLYQNKPKVSKITDYGDYNNGFYYIKWDINTGDGWYPVDTVTLQYRDQDDEKSDSDAYGTDMGTWSTAVENIHHSINAIYTPDLGAVPEDNIRYFRLLVEHDGVQVPSQISNNAEFGMPSNVSDVNVEVETLNNNQVPVFTWTNSNTKLDSAKLLIYASYDSNNPIKTIKYGSTAWNDQKYIYSSFSRYGEAIKYGFRIRIGENSTLGSKQTSILWTSDVIIPDKCTNVAGAKFANNTTVEVTWDNPTKKDTIYNGVEVAWSTNVYAWESNEKPSSTTFENGTMEKAYVVGLTEGEIYYFWVRLYEENDSTTNYGLWSDPSAGVLLADKPDKPVLTTSRSWVKVAGKLVAQWEYAASGSLPQTGAQVFISATGSDYSWQAFEAVSGEDNTCTLDLSKVYNCAAGDYALKVIVNNSLGCAESDVIDLKVAANPTCSISSSSIVDQTFTVYSDNFSSTSTYTTKCLNSMPLKVTAIGDGDLKVYVYCIDNRKWEHPHKTENLCSNDCVWSGTVYSGIEHSIDAIRLADNCRYRLQVECVDSDTGLSASPAYIDFEVHWAHQAVAPVNSTVAITEDDVAVLTVIKPSGASDTDVCDIYRVTSDRRYLCYRGASWGSVIYDWHPTFGDTSNAAYCFCTRTTDYDEAWSDVFYSLSGSGIILDYGGSRVELPWNVSISDDRKKQGEVRTHLGGTKLYYETPNIERTQSITLDLLKNDNQDLIEKLYELSRYAGPCYLRSSDGIGYPAVVDVSINREYNNQIVSCSISATEADDVEEFLGSTQYQ